MELKELLKRLEDLNLKTEVRIHTGVRTSKKIVDVWIGNVEEDGHYKEIIIFR